MAARGTANSGQLSKTAIKNLSRNCSCDQASSNVFLGSTVSAYDKGRVDRFIEELEQSATVGSEYNDI
jgi:hypothetical protein